MMRAHCDRCDALVDVHPSWVEDNEAMLDRDGRRMQGSGVNPIWHVSLRRKADEDAMLCRRCLINVLALFVKSLQLVKSDENNGHLADCRWDADAKRYLCAEGCGIKRINEG